MSAKAKRVSSKILTQKVNEIEQLLIRGIHFQGLGKDGKSNAHEEIKESFARLKAIENQIYEEEKAYINEHLAELMKPILLAAGGDVRVAQEAIQQIIKEMKPSESAIN